MPTGGARAATRVVATAVALPLLVLGFGLWERDRGASDQLDLERQRAPLQREVERLEARTVPGRGLDMQAQFRRNGQIFAGPLAAQKAREALDGLDVAITVARLRRVLPPLTVACAGLAAALSLLVLLGAAVPARLGRVSRDALVRGFSLLRRLLPPVLGGQVLLLATCAVTVVAFEALAIPAAGDLSADGVKLLGVAAVVVGASVWTALKAVLHLRRTVALFQPDPMPVLGRPVSAGNAPGLWRLLDGLAGQLGALRPDNVVVGLTGGFFVSSGAKLLQPGGVLVNGRTLYLPLPYLPLLRPDELAAVIGHELAHFSGADTEYSLRFLPIYAGIERSLDAVAAAGTSRAGAVSLLTRPALRLGVFAMEQFHHTVQGWSRLREFAADAAGAGATSANAAARALLRVAAAETRIDESLDDAFQAPDAAPPDLVAAILHHACERGLDDPAPRLEERQPHPTDSHPPTRQRLAALDRPPGPAALAEAAAPPPPDAADRLALLFADPAALCRAATADFLHLARERAGEAHRALEDAAAAVGPEEQVLHENTRAACLLLIGMGGVFVLLGLALLLFRPNGLGWTETRLLAGLAAAGGLGLAAYGAFLLRRGQRPFLRLRPDGLSLPGLDRPIAWEHVLDLDVALDRGRVSTRLLLPPEAPFPVRLSGRRVKLDGAQRIVTFTAGLPRGMDAQGFADLLGRYRLADAARRALAAEAPSPSNKD